VSRRVLPAAAAAFVSAALLAGCGGGGNSTSVKGTGTTTTVGGAAGGSVTTVAGGNRATGSGGKAGGPTTTAPRGATTTSTLPTTVNGAKPAPLEAKMGAPCVKPNQTQTITVKSTPGFQVAIATQWPDGAGHLDWNGWAVGVIPANGVFVKSWVIPPAAGAGNARNDVTVTNRDGSEIALAHPTWRIASSCR